MIDGVTLNDDILATVGRDILLADAALHAYTIVAHIDGAVDYESYIDIREVYAVAILCIPRTAYADAIDDDIATVVRVNMKTWCILHVHSLDEYVFAGIESDEVVADALILLRLFGYIRKLVFQLPGIPQRTVVSGVSTQFLVHLPFHITLLVTLYGSPLYAIAVDDSFASDGDILTTYGIDAGEHSLLSVSVPLIEAFVRREENHGSSLHMEFDIINQFDGTSEPHTLSDHYSSTSFGRQSLGGFLECLCAQGDSIVYGSAVSEPDFILWYLGYCDSRHWCGQVFVISVIIVSPCSYGEQGEEEGKENGVHRFRV